MIFNLLKIFQRPIEQIPKDYPYFTVGVGFFIAGIVLAFLVEFVGEITSIIGFFLILFDIN